MKRIFLILLVGITALLFFGCGNSSKAAKSSKADNYVSISKEKLIGVWKCTDFVFNNGMKSNVMAKHQSNIEFTEKNAKYMKKTFDYSIKNKKILFSINKKPAKIKPIVYDGEKLIMLGDDAKIYYKK